MARRKITKKSLQEDLELWTKGAKVGAAFVNTLCDAFARQDIISHCGPASA
jgi:hypothetical protein